MINEQAKSLRKKLAKKELVVGCGCRDALDAKLVDNAGFDFVFSSSLGVSASYAVPDSSLISMKQFLEAARSMVEVVDIPVIIDADTGYGNANNVYYAVRLFDQAGLAAMIMEDKKFPKDNSLLEGGRQTLSSIEDYTGKIKAAKDAQLSEDFIVIARVEALIAGWGHEEAMKRAIAYEEAGADYIMIHSKSRSSEEIVKFAKSWAGKAQLVIVPTMYPQLIEEKIKELGTIKIVIYANQTFRAAVKATELLLKEIKEAGGIHTIDNLMVPVSRIFELQGVPQMKENEKKYLR